MATLAKRIADQTLMVRIARIQGDAVSIARQERYLSALIAKSWNGVGTN